MIIQSLSLDSEGLTKVLDSLDANSSADRFLDESSKPGSYRIQNCVLHLWHLGDVKPRSFICATRLLSDDGIVVLHKSFVHTGTKCSVQLCAVDGSISEISGTLVHCRHAMNEVHELTIRFDERIVSLLYLPRDSHVNCIGLGLEADREQELKSHLRQMDATLESCDTMESALDVLREKDIHVVFYTPNEAALETEMKGIRGECPDGLVYLIDSSELYGNAASVDPVSRVDCLDTPINSAVVFDVLDAWRAQPVFSPLRSEAGFGEIIRGFVDSLSEALRSLTVAALQRDLQELRAITEKLHIEGGAFGFEDISRKALEIHDLSDPFQEMESLLKMVTSIKRHCWRAMAS